MDSRLRGNDEWSGRNHEGTPPTSSERLLGLSIFVPTSFSYQENENHGTPGGFFHRLVVLPSPPPLDSGAVSGFEGAFAGKTKWGRRVGVGGRIAVGVLSRDVSAWIPAFAGMTNGAVGPRRDAANVV